MHLLLDEVRLWKMNIFALKFFDENRLISLKKIEKIYFLVVKIVSTGYFYTKTLRRCMLVNYPFLTLFSRFSHAFLTLFLRISYAFSYAFSYLFLTFFLPYSYLFLTFFLPFSYAFLHFFKNMIWVKVGERFLAKFSDFFENSWFFLDFENSKFRFLFKILPKNLHSHHIFEKV